MGPDVATRFNGIEKTLAGVLVALVDVSVLAKTRAILCIPNQIVEVLSVKSFHELFCTSSLERCDDLANRSVNGKLPRKEAAATHR